MNIRPYQTQDWHRLREIHDLARQDELRASSLEAAFLPLDIAAEREDLFGYALLVGEVEARVEGFIAFNAEEIAWLYVDPQCYRNGVGKALVQAVLDAASGPLSIEVLEGNAAALLFYRACGFVEVGMQKGRMPGNEDYAVTVHVLRSGPFERPPRGGHN